MNTISLTVMSDDHVMSDEQLWHRSREGDREAFSSIVERYQSLICSLAYSACGNLARSEDLAQETFIAAWQNLGELREPSSLRAWLCGIVRNLAANAVRREQRRGGTPTSLDSAHEYAGTMPIRQCKPSPRKRRPCSGGRSPNYRISIANP